MAFLLPNRDFAPRATLSLMMARAAGLTHLIVDIVLPLLVSLSSLFGLGLMKGTIAILLASGLLALPVALAVLATRATRSPVWGLALVLLALAASSVSLATPLLVFVLLLLLSLLPVLLASTSGRLALLLLFSSVLLSCCIIIVVSISGSWTPALAAYVWGAVILAWVPVLVAGILFGPPAVTYVLVVLPKLVLMLLLSPSSGILLISLVTVVLGWWSSVSCTDLVLAVLVGSSAWSLVRVIASQHWMPYVEADGVLLYAVTSALVLPVLFASGVGCLLLPKLLILSLWAGLPVSWLGLLKLAFVAGLTNVPATGMGLALSAIMLSWTVKVVLNGLSLDPAGGEAELPSFWFLPEGRYWDTLPLDEHPGESVSLAWCVELARTQQASLRLPN